MSERVEMREERVARLRAEVRSGSYRMPTAEQLAEAMLDKPDLWWQVSEKGAALALASMPQETKPCPDCGNAIRKSSDRCTRCHKRASWRRYYERRRARAASPST